MARTHVVMSDELLEAIDVRVGGRGRSRFLEEAAREKLERIELEEALVKTKGLVAGKNYRHWRDRTVTANCVHEGRSRERKT